jgi:hypothetical protein
VPHVPAGAGAESRTREEVTLVDDRLILRIGLFRESGRVSPEVAAFVTDELNGLADEGHAVTEDTAGMLTSHLMMALTRLLDGEAINDHRTDEQMAAELAGHRCAVARAHAVAGRARKELGVTLPESEISFLALHLTVLAQRRPT